MPEVTARGIKFHVQMMEPPSAGPCSNPRVPPVVVFVHGLVMDNLSSFYYTLAGPTAMAGNRVVLYDLRGHGLSDRPPAGYSAAEAVADLFGVLDGLGLRQPVYLVANSFGGVIALNAALAQPERIAGLVMVESYGPAERAGEWTEEMLNTLSRSALVLEYERLVQQMRAIGRRQLSRQAAVAEALINGTTLLADLAAAEPIRPADLAEVRCPVLAVYGEHSDVAEAGRLLVEHVPDCVRRVMAGHAHTVLREGTEELLEVMLSWLAAQSGQSGQLGMGVPVEAS